MSRKPIVLLAVLVFAAAAAWPAEPFHLELDDTSEAVRQKVSGLAEERLGPGFTREDVELFVGEAESAIDGLEERALRLERSGEGGAARAASSAESVVAVARAELQRVLLAVIRDYDERLTVMAGRAEELSVTLADLDEMHAVSRATVEEATRAVQTAMGATDALGGVLKTYREIIDHQAALLREPQIADERRGTEFSALAGLVAGGQDVGVQAMVGMLAAVPIGRKFRIGAGLLVKASDWGTGVMLQVGYATGGGGD